MNSDGKRNTRFSMFIHFKLNYPTDQTPNVRTQIEHIAHFMNFHISQFYVKVIQIPHDSTNQHQQ